jgi:phosphoglycolate phosphatase-like HAD superfamily hydrolase
MLPAIAAILQSRNRCRMPSSLRGVIFDFDGPIFDGRAASQEALTATFDQFAGSVGRPDVAANTLPLYGPGPLIAMAGAISSAIRTVRQFSKFDTRLTLVAGNGPRGSALVLTMFLAP